MRAVRKTIANLVVTGLAAIPAAALGAETITLNAWLDQAYEKELAFSPEQLTALGRRDFYDRVDDASAAADAQRVTLMRESVAQLESRFDVSRLGAEERASYEFWKYRVAQAQAQLEFADHHYYLNQFDGSHTWPVVFMANYHQVESEADMLAYISRLQGFSTQIGQVLQRAQDSARKGIRPPRFAYEFVIAQSGELIRGTPFDESEKPSALWADATAKITALEDAGQLSAQRAEELQAQVRQVLTGEFLPAYQAMISWLQGDIDNTDKEPRGVASLPRGRAYYQAQLAFYTQSDMTADEIHALGLREVARIHGEMDAIRKQVGFDGDLRAFMKFVREDARFYYPDTDEGRAAYMEKSRQILDDIGRQLPQAFGRLPNADLVVKRVEPFKERDGGAAFYFPGTPDGSRPGYYYLHLSDMSALNRAGMETLAYHEGNPGHHMQSSIALENTDLPFFRRNEWFSAYGEGWALYAELLGKELGGFEDPYSDYGRLNSEIFRALRLVVDTGMHAKGWSEEQAVQYMLDNASYPEPKIRSEVRRYLVAPGQATSYKAGMLRLQTMRERAEQALGERFDLRGFHDLVLGGGSLPLPILEQRVEAWVASQR